jgi:uncharacterized protein YkwD
MRRAIWIILAALSLGALSGLPSAGQDTSGCFNGHERWMREAILDDVNGERAKNGLEPVACDSALSAVAEDHAVDMSRRNYFSHTTPEGKQPSDRVAAAGIAGRCVAENIAFGDDDPGTLVRRWMGSPGHRQNILGDYTKVGIGSYHRYYVLLLIRE